MLYPSEFLICENILKNDNYIRICFNNPIPSNPRKINQYFRKKYKLKKFKLINYMHIIDCINNYFYKNIIINGCNSIFLIIITAIFQSYNTKRKQYFVFPNTYEAEVFYFKLRDIIGEFNFNIRTKLSHSGIKDMNMINNLSQFDIIVYTGGRFINNLKFKNINIFYNTIYIFDFQNFNTSVQEKINSYFNSHSEFKFSLINYVSNKIENHNFNSNYQYFNIL